MFFRSIRKHTFILVITHVAFVVTIAAFTPIIVIVVNKSYSRGRRRTSSSQIMMRMNRNKKLYDYGYGYHFYYNRRQPHRQRQQQHHQHQQRHSLTKGQFQMSPSCSLFGCSRCCSTTSKSLQSP